MFFESNRDQAPFYNIGDNFCEAHLHRSTEILYVLSGSKSAIVDGREYLLRADDALLIPPYAVHILPLSGDGEQIAFSIQAEYALRFDEFMQTNMPVAHLLKGTPEMRALALSLQSANNQVLYEGIANHLLGLMMNELVFAPKERTNSPIQFIMQFIDEHFAEELTLPRLAKQFGYSPNYFSNLFRRYFRMSVPQYVNAVRVRKSLPLLKKMTVAGASYECGFRNPQTYFLAFKRVMGRTPHDYAKNIK